MTRAAPTAGDVLHSLADPTRRAIYERLARQEATVSQLKAGFAISQPAVSQHLAALRKARLVSDRRVGRNRIYRTEPRGLAPLVDWIRHYQLFWDDRVTRLRTLLDEHER